MGIHVFRQGIRTQRYARSEQRLRVVLLLLALAIFLVDVGNRSHIAESLFDAQRSLRRWRDHPKGSNRECHHVCDWNRHCRAALFTWAKYALKVYVAPSGYYRLVCTVDRSDPAKILSFVVFYYGLSYWVPFVIVIYYLVQTLRIVVRSMIERRQLTALPAVTVNAKTTVQFPTSVIKSKALWYVIAVVVSNALLPAPYIVVQILRGARVVLPDKLFVATGFIFHFNFLANSAFYCFWAKTLTRSLWDVLRCRRLHNAS